MLWVSSFCKAVADLVVVTPAVVLSLLVPSRALVFWRRLCLFLWNPPLEDPPFDLLNEDAQLADADALRIADPYPLCAVCAQTVWCAVGDLLCAPAAVLAVALGRGRQLCRTFAAFSADPLVWRLDKQNYRHLRSARRGEGSTNSSSSNSSSSRTSISVLISRPELKVGYVSY